MDDYGTITRSVTEGFSGKVYSLAIGADKRVATTGTFTLAYTGYYTTTSLNNTFGTLTSQLTNGASYNSIGGALKVVGIYTTTAASADIDSYGTITKTNTEGFSGKDYSGVIDANNRVTLAGTFTTAYTGYYTTTSLNNSYGTLTSQVTNGVSYNSVAGTYTVVGKYTTTSPRQIATWTTTAR